MAKILGALLLACCCSRAAGARRGGEGAAAGPWVIGGDNSNFKTAETFASLPVEQGGRGGRGPGGRDGGVGPGRGNGPSTRFGRGRAAAAAVTAATGEAAAPGGVRAHLTAECSTLNGIVSCDLDADCEAVLCTTTDNDASIAEDQNQTDYSGELLQSVVDAWTASEGRDCRIRETVVGARGCGMELFPLKGE